MREQILQTIAVIVKRGTLDSSTNDRGALFDDIAKLISTGTLSEVWGDSSRLVIVTIISLYLHINILLPHVFPLLCGVDTCVLYYEMPQFSPVLRVLP